MIGKSGGAFLRVTDDEILAAIPALAQGCGVFAEPAAAAAYAGLVKGVRRGWLRSDERVVVLATGSGLKDVSAATRSLPSPSIIAPRLADVRQALRL